MFTAKTEWKIDVIDSKGREGAVNCNKFDKNAEIKSLIAEAQWSETRINLAKENNIAVVINPAEKIGSIEF